MGEVTRKGVHSGWAGMGALVVWTIVGVGFPVLGWVVGGLLGAWTPRIACAAGATAIAVGLLNRRPGAALVGAISAAILSVVAVQIGELFFSPLLAWPVAGLVIGAVGAFAFRRRRAKIAFVIGAPLLGSVGVLAGMVGTFLVAKQLNDSRLAAQILLGGAVGFGLLLMACAAITGRWLDATRTAGEAS
jgi:hypothetical protein